MIAHVSNVIDPLNYFLMLEDDSAILGKGVISVEVKYRDTLYHQGLPIQPGPEKGGICYKARLAGLAYPSNDMNDYGYRSHYKPRKIYGDAENSIKIFINRFLKDCEMWVMCEIIDIDKFNRLIVNLYDPVTHNCLNEMLMAKYDSVFIPFFGKNGRKD